MRKQIITGRVLAVTCILFLLMDCIGKLLMIPQVVESTVSLGYQPTDVRILGIILFICTVFLLIPRTFILGLVLVTGYLGGAVAIHFRANSPLFSHTLFPVYLGVTLWLGSFLMNQKVRSLFGFSEN